MYLFGRQKFIRVVAAAEGDAQPLEFATPNVGVMAKAGDSLFVGTGENLQLIGSLPQPGELKAMWRRKGGLDAVVGLLSKLSRDLASEATIGLFCELWKEANYFAAFEAITRVPVIGYILALFAILGRPPPAQPLKFKVIPASDTMFEVVLESLRHFLAFTRDRYLASPSQKSDQELPLVNVSYAACLAHLGNYRQLAEVIDGSGLNVQGFTNWVNDNQGVPTLRGVSAVLTVARGEVADAIGLWQHLFDATEPAKREDVVAEVAYAIQKLPDSKGLGGYLDWVLHKEKESPRHTLLAIMSVAHDPDIVQQWLAADGLAVHGLRYHCFILSQPGARRPSILEARGHGDHKCCGHRMQTGHWLSAENPNKNGLTWDCWTSRTGCHGCGFRHPFAIPLRFMWS
jgi:hypothetical protein